MAFGIFQVYYSQHPLFAKHPNYIPTIGTLATGISYLGVPFMNPIAHQYPLYHRHFVIFGWFLCIIGLVGASFATSVWHLLVCQGAIYGIGSVVCNVPIMIMLNEWFERRRGLAYGIQFASSGVSGVVLPFILQPMLATYGFQTTLRGYAVATAIISGPALLVIRHRIPVSAHTAGSVTSKLREEFARLRTVLLHNRIVWLFSIPVLLQGLAFFLPNMFLPSYAAALGLPASSGSLILALTAAAQVGGQILLGHLSDKTSIYFPTTLSTTVSALGVFLLWGFGKTLAPLAVLAVVWGFFANSYSVLWTKIAMELVSTPEDVMTLYGWFSFERGIGNIVAGPIGAKMVKFDMIDFNAYAASGYFGIVIFTGIMLGISSCVTFAFHVNYRRNMA